MNTLINYKDITSGATIEAGNITNSVLVLARLAGVLPEKLAKGLVDSGANGTFFAKFTAELVEAKIAEAKEVEANKK